MAKAKSEVIKFDTSVLTDFIAEGGNFLIDPKAEKFLDAWLKFKERVEEADKIVRLKLQEEMAKKNTLKIDGESIKVYRRYFGERYEMTDPNLALGMGVAVEEVKIKVDPKAVDAYIKSNDGSLPECIKLKERTESVVISKGKADE